MPDKPDGQPRRVRLLLSMTGLTIIGIGAVIAATLVTSDFVAGGLVGVANTAAAGLAYGMGKLIEKD